MTRGSILVLPSFPLDVGSLALTPAEAQTYLRVAPEPIMVTRADQAAAISPTSSYALTSILFPTSRTTSDKMP
jgi:hypothetical protein